VAVPTYNEAKFIGAKLGDIARQNLKKHLSSESNE